MLHSIHTTVSDPRLPSEPLPAPAMTDSSTQTDLFTVLQKQRLKLRKPREASEKKNKKKKLKKTPVIHFLSLLLIVSSPVFMTREQAGRKSLTMIIKLSFFIF